MTITYQPPEDTTLFKLGKAELTKMANGTSKQSKAARRELDRRKRNRQLKRGTA